MTRRITFIGVVRFTDRVLVASYSPSEADDALIVKEASYTHYLPKHVPSRLAWRFKSKPARSF